MEQRDVLMFLVALTQNFQTVLSRKLVKILMPLIMNDRNFPIMLYLLQQFGHNYLNPFSLSFSRKSRPVVFKLAAISPIAFEYPNNVGQPVDKNRRSLHVFAFSDYITSYIIPLYLSNHAV